MAFRVSTSSLVIVSVVLATGCAVQPPPPASPSPSAGAAKSTESAGAKPTALTAKAGATAKPAAPDPCTPRPDFEAKLASMQDEQTRSAFGNELLAEKPAMKTPQRAYFAWLIEAARYRFTCLKNNGEMPPVVWDKTHKASEQYVEYAMKTSDCGRFYALTSLDLYPFEARFSKELLKRDFGSAEVTRRLWLDSLETSLGKCSAKLSRRSVMTVQAKRDKLKRIVGLDDQMLVELRTKLIAAVEANDTNGVIAYSQAVTEREKALDSMNAAEHEANLRAIEAKARADAAVKMAQATPASSDSPSKGGAAPAKSTATGDMRQAAADVRKTVEDVHATAETGKKVLSLFGL